jgi:hypothetical protein
MSKKWEEIETINLRNENINEKVYEQMIEEVANVIYIELCQLQKKSLSGRRRFRAVLPLNRAYGSVHGLLIQKWSTIEFKPMWFADC